MKQNKLLLACGIAMAVSASNIGYAAIELQEEQAWLKTKLPQVKAADEMVAYYVRYKKSSNKANLQTLLSAKGIKVDHDLAEYDTLAVSLPASQLNSLRAMSDIEFMEPVPVHQFQAQVTPWNVDQFQARDVWDKDRDGIVDPGAPTGAGVKFCIIDTGFYAAHDDFQGITHTGNSQIAGEAYTEDEHGHGTHVAGTANAVNNNIGVVGVMPGGAELHIVKIFNNAGVWSTGESNLGAAATACKDAGANAISMSLGGGNSQTENNIFQDLYDNHNIINIAAAGNDGNDVQSYPAGYPSVISVGALDQEEGAVAFSQTPFPSNNSNYNDTNGHWDATELSGGGANVLSTWPGPPGGSNGGVPVYTVANDGNEYSATQVEDMGSGDVTENLVDGSTCENTNPAWNGQVVLCERGNISFADKMNNAADSGAAAVVLYNNVAGVLNGTCNSSCNANATAIPGVALTQTEGQFLLTNGLGLPTRVVSDPGSCNGCIGGYNSISGTSMATPGVAAGIAWAWEACGGPSGITNKQLRLLLRESAKDLSGIQPFDPTPPPNGPGESDGDEIPYGAGYDRVTGWGLVQLKDALELGNQLYGSTCPIGLNVTPAEIEVCTLPGAPSADFTVTLDDSFDGTSDMTVSGVPAGASGGFSVNPVSFPIDSTVFTVSSLGGLPSSSNQITLTATDQADANNTSSSEVTLNLVDNTPDSLALTSPADGSTGVMSSPVLTWSLANQADTYDIEILEAGSIIESASDVVGNNYTVSSALSSNTLYTWRVTAQNVCGGSQSSEYSFTTSDTVCQVYSSSDVPVIISESGTPSITSDLIIEDSGNVVDVNVVNLVGTHTYISDLTFSLENPVGSSATLFSEVCGTLDDFDLGIDDQATPGALPCPPTDGGMYRPVDSLNTAFVGEDTDGTWQLTVSDSANQDGGSLASWGLEICYTPVVSNTPPTANGQNVTTDEDVAVGITLTGSDPDSDPLTYTVASGPANGSLTGTAPNLNYTPNANFNGNDSFTFTVNDGTVDSSAATVSINVVAGNDAPTADSQTVVTDEDTAVAITLSGSDPDGDTLTYSVGSPSSGSLSGTVPNLTYTPNANFNGSDSFTFTVNDGTVDSSAATVSINVGADNDAPTADSQVVGTDEDVAVGITLTGSDPDSDPLTYTVASGPANGSLSGTAPNLTYTPNANFNGSDSFTFTVNDGTVDSSAATVTVNVDAVNDAPSMSVNSAVYVNLSEIANPPAQNLACQFDFGPANEDSSQAVADMNVVIVNDTNNVLNSIDVDNSGALSYSFSGNTGEVEVSVSLQDDGGTANNGDDTSSTYTFMVNVQDYVFRGGFEVDICQ